MSYVDPKGNQSLFLDAAWIMKEADSGDGKHADMSKGSESVKKVIGNALKKGYTVTLITDHGNKRVKIVDIKDGKLKDEEGKPWGAFTPAFDATGKEGFLLTPPQSASTPNTSTVSKPITKLRTLEEIKKEEKVSDAKAKKIQDEEVLAFASAQRAKKEAAKPKPPPPQEKPNLRGPGGRFVRQNVPTGAISANLHNPPRTMQDDMLGAPEHLQPIFDDTHLHTGKYPNGKFVRTNTPLAKLSEQINQSSRSMTDMAFPEPEDRTRHAMRDLEQKRLFLMLGHGFVRGDEESLQNAIRAMDPILDKLPPKQEKASNPAEKLHQTNENIQELIKEANKPRRSKGGGFGVGAEAEKTLKNIEENTKQTATLLSKFVKDNDVTPTEKHNRNMWAGLVSLRRKARHSETAHASRIGGRRDRDGGSNNDHDDDEGSGLLELLGISSLGKRAGKGLFGLAGKGLSKIGGAAIGRTVATYFGRGLMAIAPELAAGVMGAFMFGMGLKDNKKVRERMAALDANRKDMDKGTQTAQSMPTDVDNVFKSGQADYKQFSELKTDDEKVKYLQSYGVAQNDIDRIMKKSGPKDKSPDNNGSSGGNETANDMDEKNHIVRAGGVADILSDEDWKKYKSGVPYSVAKHRFLTPEEISKNKELEKQFNGGSELKPEQSHTSDHLNTAHYTPTDHQSRPKLRDPGTKIPGDTYTQEPSSGVLGAMGTNNNQGSATQMPNDEPITSFNPSASFSEKAPQVMQRLMSDFGLTAEQAAGIVGNLGHESGGFKSLQEVNPLGGGQGGYGWAQWTGPRRREYMAWCKNQGLDPASDEANYGFLKKELGGSYSSAITAVKKTNNIKDATVAFEQAYERAGVKAYASREGYAQQALQAFGGSQTGDKTQEVAQNKTSGGEVAAKSQTGQVVAKATEATNTAKAATASAAAKAPNINIAQNSSAPVQTTGQQVPGVASVRNDDPTLLRAIQGDIRMS